MFWVLRNFSRGTEVFGHQAPPVASEIPLFFLFFLQKVFSLCLITLLQRIESRSHCNSITHWDLRFRDDRLTISWVWHVAENANTLSTRLQLSKTHKAFLFCVSRHAVELKLLAPLMWDSYVKKSIKWNFKAFTVIPVGCIYAANGLKIVLVQKYKRKKQRAFLVNIFSFFFSLLLIPY